MADVLSPEQRSRVMSRIRGSNTKPEVWVRKGLFALGFRYRLHRRDLPGRPDVVLPRYNAAVFINGCFWHGHDCHLFRPPATRTDFWRSKIEANRARDARNIEELRLLGWRVLVIWECAIRGNTRHAPDAVISTTAQWLTAGDQVLEITGSRDTAPRPRDSETERGGNA